MEGSMCASERIAGATALGLLRRRPLAVCLSFAILGCLGCGDGPEGPPTYHVDGTLFIDGKPATEAQIILHPADGRDFDRRGARPTGRVDADGSFTLTTYQPGDGAPAGRYVVTVYWAENPQSLEPSPDRLQGRYLDPAQSNVEVEIPEEDCELPPLNLTAEPQ